MQTLYIHPENPQPRLIKQAVEALQNHQLIICPNGPNYWLIANLSSNKALEKLTQFASQQINNPPCLLCQNISQASEYVQIDNQQHKILKNNSNQSMRFVLPANKNTPKKLIDDKQKSVGIAFIQEAIMQNLADEANLALAGVILLMDNQEECLMPYQIEMAFEQLAEIFISTDERSNQANTLIDLTSEEYTIVHQGKAILE
ncbi:Sua5/YciO/YrdC/YwlC family protein [Moraxella nasicaprae]|uniref:Sua5/YciO/YrdC/YwlC family protein n=1 Tax=Moraxella nasicaprae TaxID=2904122 RepID=A0ABY6F5Y0_9GAMM|nr:Sua5/YciO/YrdC/YwlC family protein [Moraxella nasicaprae]UXZ05501.1 Sua5/YciO/YrdC/YwlC family protein [Moraxella nasicaprae]